MAQDSTNLPAESGPPKREGEEEIEASKAPLLDHIAELRSRVVWALSAIAVAFMVCFLFAKIIYNWLLWPYLLAETDTTFLDAIIRHYDPTHIIKPQPANGGLIFTAPLENFFTQMQLAFFGAIFLAFPVIATQIYRFVAPGLYKNERGAFVPYLIATPVLFLIGASVVYFIALPLVMKFSLGMQQEAGPGQLAITLQSRVSEYLSFVMTLIIGFGLVFQLPVILTLLARAGLITSDFLRRQWRYAYLGIVGVTAMIAPPDAASMIGMALPTVALYEGSIRAVKWVEKRKAIEQAKRDAAGT
jgi:sec-independent protein translocase protein TatC